MRICIDMGHTPASPGAGGQFDELNADREVGKRVIAELERRGHTVYNSTPPDYMGYPDEISYRTSYANARDLDLFVSIHFNAAGGGAHGTEVLYYSGDSYGYEVASRMSAKVSSALGTYGRGAKARTTEVGVIRDTNATAVLLETCFCDNERDAALYWACPWDRLINAICDGIDNGKTEPYEEEDMQLSDKLNDYKLPDGTNNNVANVLNRTRINSDNLVTKMDALTAKVDKLSAGGATVDYDKLANKVADVIYARMKA